MHASHHPPRVRHERGVGLAMANHKRHWTCTPPSSFPQIAAERRARREARPPPPPQAPNAWYPNPTVVAGPHHTTPCRPPHGRRWIDAATKKLFSPQCARSRRQIVKRTRTRTLLDSHVRQSKSRRLRQERFSGKRQCEKQAPSVTHRAWRQNS